MTLHADFGEFLQFLWPRLAAAYLLGAIPTAYIAGRLLKGIDIRKHGSGNVGATNVFRVLGTVPGVLVLAVDILKGYFAASLLDHDAPLAYLAAVTKMDIWVYSHWFDVGGILLGLAAVLGHSFTVFLQFKGGKGVASSAGVIMALAPKSAGIIVLSFLAVFAATRMVSAGSLVASALMPLLVHYYKEGGRAPGWPAWLGPVQALALALTAIIWVRHIPNIQRILQGKENKFGGKK